MATKKKKIVKKAKVTRRYRRFDPKKRKQIVKEYNGAAHGKKGAVLKKYNIGASHIYVWEGMEAA